MTVNKVGKRAAGVVAMDASGFIGIVSGISSAAVAAEETWVLPKGHIEETEWWPETALREAREELGAIGIINHQTAFTYETLDWPIKGDRYVVTFYVLHVTEKGTPTEGGRTIKWLKPEDAIQLLSFAEHREIVNQLLREGSLMP